ncbi:hypothetical protein FRACYDRAFT_238292 [Fragilariopsis cylindrus CCMP1102]|uniref:Uncharacterized protein n=1 Tax=Fragilariopsis cylindrus CCMP1102 TaxID=635003 RepID=A0A1E7FIB1_9STRA|nr:hypothetical protein FRACYDRAFT_238292 [Fragilariopsis cylindrus CCMP1102]|eukprot:OEU17864.1 hypothetical protein FRACYDRAFT_238292 [Fragilariopsis cylindrus CCMP1102]
MAPSNKKQRGRKNRKNQTLSASVSASASASSSDSASASGLNTNTNSRAVSADQYVDAVKYFVDKDLMTMPDNLRSRVNSMIARDVRCDADEIASLLKERDEHNESNDTATLPNNKNEIGRVENKKNQASVSASASASISASANTNDMDVDVIRAMEPFGVAVPVLSHDETYDEKRKKKCTMSRNQRKGRATKKKNNQVSASVVKASDSSAGSSGHNINNVDDNNNGKSSSVYFSSRMMTRNQRKKRAKRKKNNQVSASVVKASDSSAGSSGHNIINNVDGNNNGKFSSVDFWSRMNQKRLNNLDIIDPVANKQSKLVLQADSAAANVFEDSDPLDELGSWTEVLQPTKKPRNTPEEQEI